MSSGTVGISLRVVKLQLRIKSPFTTCIDVTPNRARLGRVLEVSTGQVHRVTLSALRGATDIDYDPAHMASILYRVAHQNDVSGTDYDAETVQQVAKRFADIVNAVEPPAPDGRYSRRLNVD